MFRIRTLSLAAAVLLAAGCQAPSPTAAPDRPVRSSVTTVPTDTVYTTSTTETTCDPCFGGGLGSSGGRTDCC